MLTALLLALIGFQYIKYQYSQAKLTRLAGCPSIITGSELTEKLNQIVLIGDSRAWEFGLWLGQHNSDLMFDTIALPGETSSETICKVTKYGAALPRGKVALISLGINDIVTASMLDRLDRQRVEQSAANNIVRLSKYLLARYDTVMVWTVVPPIKPDLARKLIWGSNIVDSVNNLNDALRRDLPEQVILMELGNIFYDSKAQQWNPVFARDALHWNDLAYEQLLAKTEERINN